MARATLSNRSIVGAQPDRRVATLPISEEAVALRARVRDALAGEAWADDDGRIAKVAEELGRLMRDTSTIQARMLDCGRRLLRLQELAGEGGYKALHQAGLVPVSESMASKLRTVAAAVDSGRIPAASLPRAVEAAVIVARLPEGGADRLLESGVLRPEATAKELRDAVKPQAPKYESGLLTNARRRALERRRARLLAEVARIDELLGNQQAGKLRG